jgi:hypothetical protein
MNTIKAIEIISNSKLAAQINEIIEDIPKELSDILDEAHDRYQHLINITSGNYSEDIIKKDKIKFSNMINVSESGLPIFDDNDCVSFMSQTYALPELLCRIYIANDYHWTIASVGTSNDNEMEDFNNTLMKHLKNEDDIKLTYEFLIQRDFLSKVKLS